MDERSVVVGLIEDRWREWYEKSATRNSESYEASGWTDEHTFLKQLDLIRGRLIEGDAILDVGCGPGADSRLLGELGYRVIGVDFSPMMLRRTMGDHLDNVQYVVANAYHLPFRGRSFNIIVCTGVLQNISTPARVVEEFGRVCAEGGQVLISTLNRFCPEVVYTILVRVWVGLNRGSVLELMQDLIRLYDRWTLRRLLMWTGFKEVQITYVFLFPSFLRKFEDLLQRFGDAPLLLPMAKMILAVGRR